NRKKIPYKKLKRKAIPKTVKSKVWNTYIGNEKGISKCMCCQSHEISQMNFEAGHVIADSKGGKSTVKNLRPICSLCNKSMGNKNMLKFMFDHGYVIDNNFNGLPDELKKIYP